MCLSTELVAKLWYNEPLCVCVCVGVSLCLPPSPSPCQQMLFVLFCEDAGAASEMKYQ